MLLIPKNWASFQHYKDRSPPWIKLHKELLDNSTFQRLPVASRALAPMLWLLASESKDGSFEGSTAELAFRLRVSDDEIKDGLKPLIQKGFFLVVQGASTTLADCVLNAIPEGEAEREVEAEAKTEEKPRKRGTPSPECPVDIESQTWADWLEVRKGHRAAVTPTVMKEARKEAEKAGMTLQAFLEIWCMRGSRGLQAEWLRNTDGRRQQSKPTSFAQQDRDTSMRRWEQMTGRTHPDRVTDLVDIKSTDILELTNELADKGR